jgi:adenine-specific DNA-methyltransferase
LKVLLDEIFGRKNFVSNVVWQKKYAPANDSIWLSDSHDHILVYAKDKSVWRPQKLVRGQRADAAYKNPDGDERGAWKAGDYTCAKTAEERPNLYYPITNPNTGEIVWPSRSRVWAYGEEQHRQNEADRLVWWGKTGRNKVPSFKRFLSTVEDGLVCPTVWTWQEVGHTQDGRKEQLALSQGDPFPTPKPEQLMSRILEVGSLPGDLILDAFAGSGTTGAVAHKMHRRWIMIELGDHAETHVLPRLRKVVDGADPGGITDSVGWKGGGGFRYYRLAPSLLERDQWDNWVISKQFNPAMLAEAVCKLEGFTYAPSQERYWQHGHSTERDYIYVTTQKLTHQQLHALSEEVGPERSLLVCCAAFRGSADQWPNLTLKKIPKAVMDRCEWGRDDYSLSISNLPAAESLDVNGDANPPTAKKKAAPKKTKVAGQADLFGGEGEEA